jgi:hypothetical protein
MTVDPAELSPSQLRAHFERLSNPPPPPKTKWQQSHNSSPEGKYLRTEYKKGPPPKKTLAELP